MWILLVTMSSDIDCKRDQSTWYQMARIAQYDVKTSELLSLFDTLLYVRLKADQQLASPSSLPSSPPVCRPIRKSLLVVHTIVYHNALKLWPQIKKISFFVILLHEINMDIFPLIIFSNQVLKIFIYLLFYFFLDECAGWEWEYEMKINSVTWTEERSHRREGKRRETARWN